MKQYSVRSNKKERSVWKTCGPFHQPQRSPTGTPEIKPLNSQRGNSELASREKETSYVVQEDLSEHVDWFITKGNMNKETFETNCMNKRLPPEPMKTAIKKDGRAFFTKHGEMRV